MRERLDALRRRALLVLWVEALASCAIGPFAVIFCYLIALLAGLSGGWLQLAGLVALAASLLWAARVVRRPGLAEVDRRIERDSGLARWNLAMIEDRLVGAPGFVPSAATVQLFAAHRVRLAREVAGARVAAPVLDVVGRDPFGLRALLLLGVVVAAALAGPLAGPRLARGFLLPSLLGPRPQVQLWLTPPVWTGRGPQVLGIAKQVQALAGSSLSLIITGVGRGDAGPGVRFAGAGLPLGALGGGSFRARLPIERSGVLRVGSFWRSLVRVQVIVLAPRAPVVGFAGMPVQDRRGGENIGWRIDSLYGVKTLLLRLRPSVVPKAGPLPAQIVTLAARAAGSGREHVPLAASRYAGLPVRAVLAATNQRGMVGVSPPVRFRLPVPVLHNATAVRIFLLRQHLALHPAAVAMVGAGLARLAAQPPGGVTAAADRAIGGAAQQFMQGSVSHPFALLWRLMRQAELGKGFRAAQRLAASRAALERELRRDIASGTADQAALQRLVQRFERAAAQAQADRALEKLVRRIAREAQAGNKARARTDLRQLDRMLRGMQHARPLSAAQAQAEAAAQAQAYARAQAAQAAGRQLSGMMRAQSALLDQSVAAAHPAFSGNQPSGSMPPPPMAGAPAAGGSGNENTPGNQAGAQAGLQQQAAALAQRMSTAQLAGSARLGVAVRAMAQAQARLQAGDPAGAQPAQRAAIAALQQAARAVVQQQAAAQTAAEAATRGAQQAGTASGRGAPGSDSGAVGGGVLPLKRAGRDDAARRIERSLIKRDAQPGLPARAHDYYRRLLGTAD